MRIQILIAFICIALGAVIVAALKPYQNTDELTVGDMSRALEINQRDEFAYAYRACLLMDEHQYADALLDINRAIELNPMITSSYVTKASILCKLGKKVEAIQESENVIRVLPTAEGYEQSGWIHVIAGDHRAAIADYDEAIRREPNNLRLYQFRASAREEVGDRVGSGKDYRRSISLDKSVTSLQKYLFEGLLLVTGH